MITICSVIDFEPPFFCPDGCSACSGQKKDGSKYITEQIVIIVTAWAPYCWILIILQKYWPEVLNRSWNPLRITNKPDFSAMSYLQTATMWKGMISLCIMVQVMKWSAVPVCQFLKYFPLSFSCLSSKLVQRFSTIDRPWMDWEWEDERKYRHQFTSGWSREKTEPWCGSISA